MDDSYYVSRKHTLMRDFDKTLDRIGGLFVARHGKDSTPELLREARREFEALIPRLPCIG